MGEPARAEISLKIAEKLAHGTNSAIVAYRQEIAILKIVKKKEKLVAPALSHGENPELHAASNSVKLVETTDKGKFIVAKDNLKTGDVVLVENPIAACLLPNFYGSHCHHCFLR